MADILRYGIKEVADVKFYNVSDNMGVNTDGTVTGSGVPVLELDTLKVSTIEFTAEQSEARGGKGNPPLIIWDYGREVNVTLEDALMSKKMLNLLFGQTSEGGSITVSAKTFPGTYTVIGKTFARDTDGHDHVFTFYIPKAKIQSENTLTMEAEGDPTVFNMSLRVLRGDSDGTMMKLVLADEVNDTGVVDWNGAAANNLVAANFSWDKGSATIYVESGKTPVAPVEGYTWTPALAAITKDTRYVGKAQ